MVHLRCLILVALMLPDVLTCGSGRNPQAVRKDVVVPDQGEGALTATLYSALEPNPAGLLLLHDAKGHRDDWLLFGTRAQQAGFTCLAPEFTWALDGTGAFAQDSSVARTDAAFEYLRNTGIPPERIALVGAGAAANLALLYASRHREAGAVALVSPGLDFGGISADKALADLGQGAIFFVSATADAYSADSARQLQAKARGFAELREYPGAAHGTDLFTVSENAVAQLLDWLGTVLKPMPGRDGQQ